MVILAFSISKTPCIFRRMCLQRKKFMEVSNIIGNKEMPFLMETSPSDLLSTIYWSMYMNFPCCFPQKHAEEKLKAANGVMLKFLFLSRVKKKIFVFHSSSKFHNCPNYVRLCSYLSPSVSSFRITVVSNIVQISWYFIQAYCEFN